MQKTAKNPLTDSIKSYSINVLETGFIKRIAQKQKGELRMPSIREVAKLAKVSPATVSRVINGTAKVDDEKRKRVLNVISETGFVPNEVARSLFKKSARIIGLILPTIENPFFTQLASVIEQTADEYGYRLVLCNTNDQPEKERAAFSMLASMNADGIILTTNNEETYECVSQCPIPVVITDRGIGTEAWAGYIHSDHYEGGRLAAQHLIDCGCQNIVCIKGPMEISSARDRYEGYRKVCKEYGIKEQTMDCTYDFETGLSVTETLLVQYPHVDGIIACNDMVAISVYKILKSKGLRVPEDVQLIGYDDIRLAALMTPELTTIAQPIEKIGKKAAELIIHNEGGHSQKEFIFETKLIQRSTTKLKGER